MPERIQIATHQGSRIVEGYTVQPGLAVTPWTDNDRPGRGWSLTHVGSGWRLSSYGPVCLRCVHELGRRADGIDWARPADQLRTDERVAYFVGTFDEFVETCSGGCS